jgi:hypothetical protein
MGVISGGILNFYEKKFTKKGGVIPKIYGGQSEKNDIKFYQNRCQYGGHFE